MENQNGSSDGEDIPSDFFDDFAKDEFIEGLSVVDSWDDNEKKRTARTRINAEDLDKVDDLRDLIVRDKKEVDRYHWRRDSPQPGKGTEQRAGSEGRMDSFIKPGSRRDPSKTNQAIKKDKEEKVKEHLAKQLESSDDIRPPGTELDDFFEAKKSESKKQSSVGKSKAVSPNAKKPKIRREVKPPKEKKELIMQKKQLWSPRRPHPHIMYSPHRSPRRSPRRSPPRRYSPRRISPRRFSPSRHYRKSYRVSPRRMSPDLRRRLKSRSPVHKHSSRRSRSRSPNYKVREQRGRSRSRSRNRKHVEDDFLYPKDYYPPEFDRPNPEIPYPGPPVPQYAEPMSVEYSAGPAAFPYPQPAPTYSGYTAPYEYQPQASTPIVMPAPQPVPAPILPPAIVQDMIPVVPPAMVPAPQMMTTPMMPSQALNPAGHVRVPPDDALAKLVADGKLSHEDYLKLAPNKGISHALETPEKAAVLNRVNEALSRLGNVMLPARMVINNNMVAGTPELCPTPLKFCSPLKRQATIQFHFTKNDPVTVSQRNKQIIENIINTLKIENVVGKPKKKTQTMKDAETQTTKPFCDVCEIREAKSSNEVGTWVDREHFFSTVHTQVVEQDLVSSKAVFNPSGSIADGAPISIAHMTPAQLVSQLAARAKTLKQSDPPASNQYRNSHNSYEYEGRGGGSQYHGNNYNNYRY